MAKIHIHGPEVAIDIEVKPEQLRDAVDCSCHLLMAVENLRVFTQSGYASVGMQKKEEQ